VNREPICFVDKIANALKGDATVEPQPDFIVDPDQVAEQHGCPKCGERRTDSLEWLDDQRVKCLTCGHIYEPK